MKSRSGRLFTLPLIFLLSLLSFVPETSAQQPVVSPDSGSNPLPGLTRLRKNSEKAHQAPNQAEPEAAIPYQALYSFCLSANCADGNSPQAGLIQDSAGNLYGTTQLGGNFNSHCNGGSGSTCGTVFKLDSAGQETVLYAFCPKKYCTDGFYPFAGLIEDGAGNLYGTTRSGGAHGYGTVFKLDNAGRETVLYSFCATGGSRCTDGEGPTSALVEDSAGNFYGTTPIGGAKGAGTVFMLDTTNHETVLYSFCSEGGVNCTDGSQPSGVIEDGAGNLYGTTIQGGNNAFNTSGGGTVFKLDSTGHLTVLYSFCSESNCVDGNTPYAGLIEDGAGNLYGTTGGGGVNGEGAVFKLDSSGHETLVYSFCPVNYGNCDDGSNPRGGLVEDAAGNLFGTTVEGGGNEGGTVFEVDNTGRQTVLYSFCSLYQCADGKVPLAGLIEDAGGNLYGTTAIGGDYAMTPGGGGTVFKLAPVAIVALTSSTNPSYVSQAVTFSVVVSGRGPTPTGSVNVIQGSTVLGTVTLSDGQASLPATFKTKGTLRIVAGYSGDENYAPAVGETTQIVLLPNATSTTVASNLNPSTYGQAVTLTSTVSSTGPTPTGTVTFKNGNATVGKASLSSGMATLAISTLPAGTLSITADYGGNAASKISKSSPLSQVVNQASSTTAVVSSKNPSLAGQTVRFTATVSSATTPTGSVTFMDGSTALATKTLGKGTASYSTSTLGAGAHNITAVYEGTANISGSTSLVLVQTVN